MPNNSKNPAGQPVVQVNHGRLQIVVNYRGVRKYLSLNLPDSRLSRAHAEMVRSTIESDLLTNSFDPSFAKYRREAQRPSDEIKLTDDISIILLWEKYADYKRPQLSPSTIAKDFDRVANHIAKFPVSTLGGAVAIRDYLNSKTTHPHQTDRTGASSC